MRSLLLLTALLAFVGCAAPRICPSDTRVTCELQERTAYGPLESDRAGEVMIPPDVSMEDGLGEDEAIATALANNAAFRAVLTQLGMAQGDVIQAGLLTNPSVISLFPISAKQWEWTLFLPIETLVIRPERIAASEGEYERVAHQLVQNGLNLVRDARVAYTDLRLAVQQSRLAEEAAALRQEIADITDKRSQRGDISEFEALTARVDALDARALVMNWEQNVAIARTRLVTVMGVPMVDEEFSVESLTRPPLPSTDLDSLLAEALASRPDMCSAEWAVQAAARRTVLARRAFWRVDFAADGNSRGLKGGEAGPGLRMDLPIFNRNQGGIVRADAEWQQALYNRDAIRNQIVLDVRTSMAQLQQARINADILQSRIVPSLEEAWAIARRAYETGGVPYVSVLQAATQYLSARSRLLDQIAAMRRSAAELERSVGRSIATTPELIPAPPEPIVEEASEGR